MLADKHKIERERNAQLKNQLAQLVQPTQDQKLQIQRRDSTIQSLQAKIRSLEHQLNDALSSSEAKSNFGVDSVLEVQSLPRAVSDTMDSSKVTKKLEDELQKRDVLIEISSPSSKGTENMPSQTNSNIVGRTLDVVLSPSTAETSASSVALFRTGSEKVKTMPEGEHLTATLNGFDPEELGSLAVISEGGNNLLMVALDAAMDAGASREHEILAEIKDALFPFINKMELKGVVDTKLVSRARIMYIWSLLARSPELQSIKVSPVDCFLQKANSGRSRRLCRGNSSGRSSVRDVEEQILGFKVNLKPEKKSKLSSVVLKLQGIDQETRWQHVPEGKLREITEEAKSFSTGNKSLAALIVHTPAGELEEQIRSWLAENFEFLSVTGDDAMGGTTGQLERLSTAIMDGWMAGLGTAMPLNTDALGQLLSEYTKRVYTSQLQHLEDIAGTLATEEAEDLAHVSKLRSALESVNHERRKVWPEMRSDVALLALDNDALPIPSTAVGARLTSLSYHDGILKQVKDITRQSSVNTLSRSKKATMLASLDKLAEQMSSLHNIDHPCAKKQISDARSAVELIPEEDEQEQWHASRPTDSGPAVDTYVAQWNVLPFNTGSTTPFIIKCGANSNSELVIKADACVQEPKGGEIVRVVPRPSVLEKMSLEEMKQLFSQLPEALSLLTLSPTADETRLQYSRLYRTLAMKVPSRRNPLVELEKGGRMMDVRP